jgi:DNA polymerase-3 subunit epsilon
MVALDFETTGLDPAADRVISFGAIPLEQGRIRLDRAIHRTANPGVPVPPGVVPIHGIRPVDVARAPAIGAVVPELVAMTAGRTLIVWTGWIEAAFLSVTLGGTTRSWGRRMIDVRRLVVRLDEAVTPGLAPGRSETLGACAARLGVPPEPAHDALADAFITAQLFLVAVSRLEAMSRVGLRRLLRWGRPGG